MIKYEGPKKPVMPMAATNRFDMSDAFVGSTKLSLARAEDVDFTFIKDVLFKANIP